MSDYPNFTEDEVKFLETNGYSVLKWFALKSNFPEINKRKSELYPYEVGVEGMAMDVDGDWGWCRTWKLAKTLEEAINMK